jgi:signal transduction histidine kinase
MRPSPVEISADRDDVSDVLDNLIENAITYCPDGALIEVEAAALDGRGRLVVHDNGPGIPSEDEARIWDRFYRGRTGRRSAPGTGFGFAIVRQVAERWGAAPRSNRIPAERAWWCNGRHHRIGKPALPILNPAMGKA